MKEAFDKAGGTNAGLEAITQRDQDTSGIIARLGSPPLKPSVSGVVWVWVFAMW